MNNEQQLENLYYEITLEYGLHSFANGLIEIFHESRDNGVDFKNFEQMTYFLVNLPISRAIKHEDDNRSILINTAFKRGINLYDNTLINELLKLSSADRIVEKDGKSFFLFLDQLFSYIIYAKNYLLRWQELSSIDDTVFKGVALSKSSTPKKILQSRLNEIDSALKLLPSDKSLSFLKEVIEKFIEAPDEINTILFGTYLLNFDNYSDLNPEKLKALDGLRRLLNSASPIEKKHIYESVKRFIQNLFYKNSLWQKILSISDTVSNESLANIIDIIMQYGFDIESKTSPHEMKRRIQIRTYFFDFPILELQTTKNQKLNPAFNDAEYLQNFLEKLQGKFPLKSPVPNFSKSI